MTAGTTSFTAVDETADLMERRGEPNLIYLELAVAGRLDPERLRAAVDTAFAAHPATRSRRLPTPPWRTRSRWQLAAPLDAEALTVRSGPGLAPDAERRAVLDTPLDLRHAPLLRVRLLAGLPGGDRLLLVAHHAGFDGMGFVGVLLSICAAYNAAGASTLRLSGSAGVPAGLPMPAPLSGSAGAPAGLPVRLPLPLPPPGSAGVHSRYRAPVPPLGSPGLSAPVPPPGSAGLSAPAPPPGSAGVPAAYPGSAPVAPSAPVAASGAASSSGVISATAAPPSPRGAGRAVDPGGPLPPRPVRVARQPATPLRRGYGLVALGFDAERTRELARAARTAGVTLNDLLLAALGLAVTRWNTHHGRATTPLRVTMPVNTRGPQDRHAGEGNRSRLTSIDVAAAGTDPRALRDLLRAVAARTAEAKAAPVGAQGGPAALVLGSPWLPRAVRQVLAPCVRFAARSFADTTMLSNLGPITDLPTRLDGAGEITELWAAAPAPMPRGVSVTALGAHGRLHLMVRHRYEALDARAAAAFTDVLADAVADLAHAATEVATDAATDAPRPAPTDPLTASAAPHRTEGQP